ncbi:hypothetical protein OL229_15375 [Neisseriaceae bacterium JH1-16]|nr:hypothetical protein [Neisseriaceae bacterium JH1-16]
MASKQSKLIGVVLAVVVVAAAVGAYWKWGKARSGVSIESISLKDDKGWSQARDIMDKMYGKTSYDEQGRCWSTTLNENDYCMKPIAFDRVDVGNEQRLYLATSGDMPGASHTDSDGAVGAFVLNEKTQELIASTEIMAFTNDSAKGPTEAKLVELSASGYLGWLAEGVQNLNGGIVIAQPYVLAPKGKEIVDLSGLLPGSIGSDGDIATRYTYQPDSSVRSAKVFPMIVTEKDEKSGKFRTFTASFDTRDWSYQCHDEACGNRASDAGLLEDEGDEPQQEAPPANANEALFGDKKQLSQADLKTVLTALGMQYVVKDNDNWGFVTADCQEPFRLSGEVYDLNGDDKDEVWINGGNSCTSGATGKSMWLFVRDESGVYRKNFGFPASSVNSSKELNDGFPEVRFGGTGFCEAVWRWNGKEYEHVKNIATQPGGCDGK